MTRVLVIGGGPAGIVGALEAAAGGADVTLVTAERVGGRANWHSLVPSKVYLTAADHLGEAAHFDALGLHGAAPMPDLPSLRSRIAAQAQGWSEHHERQLRERGVKVMAGRASFLDAHRVHIDSEGGEPQTADFDRAIVATGSEPVFLPAIKPDGQRILAPRLAAKLADWPRHVIVIGGGVTGAEFAYFFSRMNCRVTWVTDMPSLLPRTDADIAEALEQALGASGVEILKSAPVEAVAAQGGGVKVQLKDGRALEGSHAFIAIGRRPDTESLSLAAAGIAHSPAGIAVDALCRTSQAHIYAAGDVTGAPFVANRGQAQARVAARHALGLPTPAFRPETVIEAVYTHPQVAQVGLTESLAAAEGREIRVCRARYDEALKPRLSASVPGFVKLVADARDDRLLGACAVGERAAELLAPAAVAIAGGMACEVLAQWFPAYPTLAELASIAARGY